MTELKQTDLIIGLEELYDLGHHDITARTLVLHIAPELEGRPLKRAMREARKQFSQIRFSLCQRSFRVVPVCQTYFNHPTRLPKESEDAKSCLAIGGRGAVGLHLVPDGTEDILWTVYHSLHGTRQYASGVGHIGTIANAEEQGNALPGSTLEAIHSMVLAGQNRLGGTAKGWAGIESRIVKMLETGGTEDAS